MALLARKSAYSFPIEWSSYNPVCAATYINETFVNPLYRLNTY